MTTVDLDIAQMNFLNLLDRVASGECITITRHGVPAARLIPPATKTMSEPQAVIEALKAFRVGRVLEDMSVRQMIEEGRRF